MVVLVGCCTPRLALSQTTRSFYPRSATTRRAAELRPNAGPPAAWGRAANPNGEAAPSRKGKRGGATAARVRRRVRGQLEVIEKPRFKLKGNSKPIKSVYDGWTTPCWRPGAAFVLAAFSPDGVAAWEVRLALLDSGKRKV